MSIEIVEILPLSPLQQGFLFHMLYDTEHSDSYHVQQVFELKGELDYQALKDAADALLSRHPNLSAGFEHEDTDVPVQMILKGLPLPWFDHDISRFSKTEQDLAFKRLLEEDYVKRFDPQDPPLLRFTLIKRSERSHYLILTNHHILLDGWSVPVLLAELFELYRLKGLTDRLPPPVPFRDYLQWISQQNVEATRDVWRKVLEGVETPTLIGAGHNSSNFRPLMVTRHLDVQTTQELTALARKLGITVNTVIQSAWGLMLSMLTGTNDVIFGITVSGRPPELSGVERMIGLLINTVPLRLRFSVEETVESLLQRLQVEQAELLEHQYLDLTKIQRDAGMTELFDTLVVYENYPQIANNTQEENQLAVDMIGHRGGDASHYPLGLMATTGQRLGLTISALTELFNLQAAEKVAERLAHILTEMVQRPHKTISDINWLMKPERDYLIHQCNETRYPYDKCTIVEMFERRVAEHPQAIAISEGDTQLTYAQLNNRANVLAKRLVEQGARVDASIGILMERSIDLIVAILATLKAGGCYLPLRVTDPLERQQTMLAGGAVDILLIDADMSQCILPKVNHVIAVDSVKVNQSEQEDNLTLSIDPANLAYVMYTSGSTGLPKGIAITHQNVVAFASDRRWKNGHHHRVMFNASHVFDASTYEIWVPLFNGGEIVVAPPETMDIDRLAQFISSQNLTGVFLTTGLFRLVAELHPGCLKDVRCILTGGDVLPKSTVQSVLAHCPDITIINGYGPTETTTCATDYCMRLPLKEMQSVPIGTPHDNVQVYVLDEGLQPVPIGVAGELYIAGDGLARGYLNQSSLTAERFVANPFAQQGKRMYRTGDLVRWREEGVLEFVGRVDHLVKIRGFRIELGEIETAIQSYPSVAQVVVSVREDRRQNKQLVAYVVPYHGEIIDPLLIRQWANQQLPDFMVPAAVVILDQFPLTQNGKIDVKGLPEPTFILTEGREARNQQEELLCALFAEALGLERVSIDDDFFELGGHSLLATTLMSNIRKTLGVELQLRALFDFPTVAELAKRLLSENELRLSLEPQDRPEYIPLSFAQQRLWLLGRIDGNSAVYNIPLALRLTGKVNDIALQNALNDLVARHEGLRTLYRQRQSGEPYQYILEQGQCLLHKVQVNQGQLNQTLLNAAGFIFDLSEMMPIKVTLFEIDETHSVLLILLHHIASDGGSIAPMLRDLTVSYNAYSQGEQPSQTPLSIQYADYALWQRELLGCESDPNSLLVQQSNYWQKRLSGLPEEIVLPTDRARPQIASYQGSQLTFRIEPELYQRLRLLARSEGATLFMVLQASLAILLHRLGAGDDIPLGTPIAGRTDDSLNDLIGYFANTLVLRTDLSGNPDFHQLLNQVRENTLDAYAHQDIPFERLVEVLNPARSLSRHPLFQVMLVLQNHPQKPAELYGLEAAPESILLPNAKFDLTFNFEDQFGGDKDSAALEGRIEYATDLFDRSSIERIAGYFMQIVEAIAHQPCHNVSQIPLLSDAERDLMLNQWNPNTAPVPEATLCERFENQVRKTPGATALSVQGLHVSYGELNKRANQLANHLRHREIGTEDIVALALPRSMEMIVSLLAILKVGAAYLPLDPEYPQDRLAFILTDAKPALVITDSDTAAKLDLDRDLLIINSDEVMVSLAGLSDENLTDSSRIRPLNARNLAYIIYTSGSTGKPKGVQITHHNVNRLFAATQHWFNFSESDVWTMFHSYAFDFSVWEIWGPLLYGGRLVLVPYLTSRSPQDFLRLLVDEKVTILNQTPSAFYQLIYADRQEPLLGDRLCLRQVIFGGEALELAQLAQWYERHDDSAPVLVNMYGITETTVHVSYQALTREMALKESSSIIGGAIPDLKIYVLDDVLQPTPIGVKGEMYIAGAGLARGYANRTDLTAERFVADPYGRPGDRMYRSGDLAVWNQDATLSYLGRADHQVKIRGFRIELGEIESALGSYPGVSKAVVIAREDRPGDLRLVGYVTADSAYAFDINEIRQHLRGCLPDYMIPSAIMQIDEFTLTSNGKLDRRALPKPDTVVTQGRLPRTQEESQLCQLYCEVLSLESVSIDDSFFDLGGHSLLAIALISGIRNRLGVELSIRTLFEFPTVAALATSLNSGQVGNPLDILLPLRKSGHKIPLFCFHPAAGVSWSYAGLMPYLGADRPLYGLQAARLTTGIGADSIESQAEDYLSHIRRVRPKGPYALLGWSFGCHVAHRIAELLQQQGERVELLAFMDGYPIWDGADRVDHSDRDMLDAIREALSDDTIDRKIEDAADLKSLLTEMNHPLANLEQESFTRILAEFRDVPRLLTRFTPGNVKGDLLFFKAALEPDPDGIMIAEQWQAHVNGHIEVYPIQCGHQRMLGQSALEEIGPILASKLDGLS